MEKEKQPDKKFEMELDDLIPQVREKALEIAEQLIQEEGMPREEAIREGMERAWEWWMSLEG